jgi:2-oxoglutarate dehydrogenase E2 component (dihydrolipoamide succinyltransferase)
MDVEIRVPAVGESVHEAVLAEWFKADGDPVKTDEALFLLETDKVTLEVPAGADGVLKIAVPAGQTVAVDDVVGTIVTEAVRETPREKEPEAPEGKEAALATRKRAAPAKGKRARAAESRPEKKKDEADQPRTGEKPAGPTASGPEAAEPAPTPAEQLAPSVRRLVDSLKAM